jgi:hypothetical protein
VKGSMLFSMEQNGLSNANAITLPSVAALSVVKTAVLQVPKEIKFDMKCQSRPTIGPVEFIDRLIKHDEKGEPFSLAKYQRRVLQMALRRDRSGELIFRLELGD